MAESQVDKDLIRQLVEGDISEDNVTRLQKMSRKDKDRFFQYVEVLQEKVPWDEKILLRISDKLYVVATQEGDRIVKCECGHEFGDYRENWKLQCRIRVRKTLEEFKEVYDPEPACPEPGWQEIREYFCPGDHAAQLAVEVVSPGYPIVFEMLPDLDVFYRDYLGRPLSDESSQWYKDQTSNVTQSWRSRREAH